MNFILYGYRGGLPGTQGLRLRATGHHGWATSVTASSSWL